MKRIGILILLLLYILPSKAQKKSTFRVMFYNVENLFDTIDSPNTIDEEFLPTAEKQWNSKRYNEKLDHLAQVISSVSPKDLPEIIGMAEVENELVLKDLANTEALKKGKYGIVHYDSPDKRGIDNALLYRQKEFKPIASEKIEVKFTDSDYPTRDILYVKGVNRKKDTLHIFVNHFPSRRGGKEASEPKRMQVAKILRSHIENILKQNPHANVIVMGDFNDNPSDNSMLYVADGEDQQLNQQSPMSNVTASLHTDTSGTYFYRGHWDMLDQFIISSAVLKEPKGVEFVNVAIFKQPWMLYENKRNNTFAPNRSYGGPNYYGGYSDHLPVVLTMKIYRPKK